MPPVRTVVLPLLILAATGCIPAMPSWSPAASGSARPALDEGMPEAPFRFKGEAFTGLSQHTDSRIGEDLDPELSPDGKWLVFCSTRHEERPEIYLKALNGTAVVRKTFHPAVDCQPSFSPDGSRIAFSSNRNGDFDLFVMSAAGREIPKALTLGDGDEMHPTWSPDGTKIAYAAFDARLGDWELRVVDVGTGAKTYLGITGINPSWSPDGRRLAFQRARERGEHRYSLWAVELAWPAGSAQVEASNPSEIVGDPSWAAVTPTWSRDGRRLLFATVRRDAGAKGGWRGEALWTVSLNGDDRIQLHRPDTSVSSPSWGSDDRVYFVSTRTGTKCIWSLKPMMLEPLPVEMP